MKQQEEIKEQTEREQLNEARSLREKILRLFENMDYITVMAHMQARLDDKTANSFAVPTGLDSVVIGIHKQGEVAGFYEAMNFPKALLHGAEGTIQSLQELTPEEEDIIDGS